MKTFYVSLLSCLLLYSTSLFAQTQKITGTVKDDLGETLIGVSVQEQGKTNGTQTDVDGHYSLTVSGPGAVLVFTYVGYIKQEVTAGNRQAVDVILKSDAAQLNEVVVVGYGTQKKVNLSGAVDQVNAKTLASRPISNVAQGLQGLIPNLNIDFGSGAPGAAASVNIRGITSINGGDPLILIDAVPSDMVELNRLAPQDIETISVIKDASAAAIYGARAAFGVILIKTKTGSKEGVSVNYTYNASLNKPTVLPDKITDPYIYSRLLELSTDNTPWDNVNYSDQYYQYAKERSDNPSIPGVRVNPTDNKLWEYMGNQDWTRYFLSDQTYSQDHALSVSGNSGKTQYYLSGNYNRQNGILKIADDYFDRYSFRSKVNYQIAPWLSLGNNTYLTQTKRENPSQYSIAGIYNLFPTDFDKNPDGTWANTEVGRTGARLTTGGDASDKYFSLQTQFNAEASLIKNVLRVNADFTYRKGAENYDEYGLPIKIGFGPNDVRTEGSSYVRKYTGFTDYTVLNLYATYNQKWGKHDFTAIGGFNQEYSKTEINDLVVNDLISASYPTPELATGLATPHQSISDWALQGLFYRLNYIYDDRYILELDGRYDGTSRFPKEKRFGFFPSASAAWRVDQESFMENLRSTLSNFKLRASYGALGNQLVSDYGYIASLPRGNSQYLIGGQLPVVISPPSLVSPNYTWEKVTTLNFGTDIGLFNNKLNFTFDVYQRNTKGMLVPGKEMPAVLGADEPVENAADLRTRGWELSAAYQTSFRTNTDPISFSARFVLSDSRSFITRFDNPSESLTNYRKDMELGEIWGLQSNGLFQSQAEIDALDESSIIPWDALSIVNGWPKYVDLDGNHKIETGLTANDPKDLSVIGNSSPRFRFGLDLNASWKGFDVRAFFQGVAKRDYYPIDYLYWGFYQQPYAGGYAHLLDFYRPNNDSDVDMGKHSQAYINAGLANQNLDAKYPILQAWLADKNLGTTTGNAKGLAIPQTGYMLNAAYLRFKNLTIGYTLPATLTKKWHIASVRVYASGENIYEWSALKKYYDPESINVNTGINPAADTNTSGNGYAYPWQRRYSLGLNVNF
ncbi:TonB-dependent receptor [Mucilaginibacter limnophilus]|uniref:TonB-dependent receptor n=1 Tax=Mucilaginibacter limnophilus TaxID=1932778 RepID=A0A437MSQ5_9SPHI|nr:TonB-dependent receptor [Mucilaginibacter limnophilus]RVU00684.1 TonB-dependent receptor [Mucilaginibacter limnophilus]